MTPPSSRAVPRAEAAGGPDPRRPLSAALLKTLLGASSGTRFWVHRPPGVFSSDPRLYFAYLKWMHPERYATLAVGPDTDLVVEGPHRSANTFVSSAIAQAQQDRPERTERPFRLARHCHAPAQVLRAVELGVPTIVMLRPPEEQIRAHVVFDWRMTPRRAARAYRSFYAPLWAQRQGFVVARFADAVADIPGLVARVNARFGRDFRAFSHSEEEMERVAKSLRIARAAGEALDPFRTFLPNPLKEQEKAKLDLTGIAGELAKCRQVYERFAALADD